MNAVEGAKRTLDEVLTASHKKIDLPIHNVIDKIILDYTVKVTATAAATIKYADVMNVIKEVRVVSDGNIVHYNISDLDGVLMNIYDFGETGLIHPDTDISLTAATAKEVTFTLQLSRGDILANTKQSLDITHDLKTAINDNITVNDVKAVVTISEKIFDSKAEFFSVYAYNMEKRGENVDLAAEPNISVVTKPFDASNEMRGIYELPAGANTIRRIFFISSSTGSSAARAGSEPTKLGVNLNMSRRVKAYDINWKTLQHLNEADYKLKAVAGVGVIDFGAEFTGDEFGLRGWNFRKGDQTIGTSAASGGELRMIIEQYTVNTAVFDAVSAVLEA